LQKLYDDLTAKGKQSEIAALQVGALVEEIDIKDLREAIAATQNPDLSTIYGHLAQASEKHLRAFNRQLKKRGVDYQAQALSQADVQAILAKPESRGHGKRH
jgi:rubrerythrin